MIRSSTGKLWLFSVKEWVTKSNLHLGDARSRNLGGRIHLDKSRMIPPKGKVRALKKKSSHIESLFLVLGAYCAIEPSGITFRSPLLYGEYVSALAPLERPANAAKGTLVTGAT